MKIKECSKLKKAKVIPFIVSYWHMYVGRSYIPSAAKV
jgi:hypothetical protein